MPAPHRQEAAPLRVPDSVSLLPCTGKKLDRSVVQRIQRFGQGGVFKRTVLQAIAAELLSHPHRAAAAADRRQREGHTANDEEEDDDFDELMEDPDARIDVTASGGFRPVVATPHAEALEALYNRLELGGEQESVGSDQLGRGLKAMGERRELAGGGYRVLGKEMGCQVWPFHTVKNSDILSHYSDLCDPLSSPSCPQGSSWGAAR